MAKKKKIGSDMDSILQEMQNVYMDINEQKSRILVDYENSKTNFEEEVDNIEQDSVLGKLQNDRLKLFNETLQKHMELIKVHVSLVNKTVPEPQPEEGTPETGAPERKLTSADFARIKEEMAKMKT